ncbi:MAG: lipoyl synthase [Candidatus Hodarchaeales archaeon]
MDRIPKPKWLRVKLPTEKEYHKIKSSLKEGGLHTVCEEAFCPNQAECWESGTATFLLMGKICTRACRFCDVRTGNPHGYLDHEEPDKLAYTVKQLGLRYVVLTSVDRDDLDDGGSGHLAKCIKKVREVNPGVLIEILIPDFQGKISSIKDIVDSKPDVVAHNLETVERLTSKVRDRRAGYRQSLGVLKDIKGLSPLIMTKSSLMLGLGEKHEEVINTFEDLRKVEVDILTLGQYLQPSKKHLKVVEYIHPQTFSDLKEKALQMGFKWVASGPLVRTSYRAGEFYVRNVLKDKKRLDNDMKMLTRNHKEY